MATTKAPVLLFAHGAGFCKEIWEPIIRRMQQSPLLQRTLDVEFVSLDLPYHGTKRDNSEPAQIDAKGPHVTHPANNAINLASVALHQEAKRFGVGGRPVIGIGHSMGAAALWKAEVCNTGTFDGLILFEPIYGPPHQSIVPRGLNFMAAVTLEREWKWPSWTAAVKHFETWKTCRHWHRESLASWMEGAVVPESGDSEAVVLACHPTIEASIYSGDRLWLSEQEQVHNSCVTTFHSGSRTKLFDQETFLGIMRRCPEIYKIRAPMPGKSHVMVLEDPAGCAEAILTDLEELDCFKPRASRL